MFGRKPATISAGAVFRFDNGDEVKDKITGFTGIILARTEWFNGCVRYTLQSTVLKDGQPGEGQTFDDEHLELVKKGKVVPAHRERQLAAQTQREVYTGTGGPALKVQRGQQLAKR